MATLIPNFDLAEKIGDSIQIDATTVEELIRTGVEQYGEVFRQATRQATIVVNGRAVSLLQGGRTKLSQDDTVWFILPAGGG